MGDSTAAAELAELEHLRRKGKLATYGTVDYSSSDEYPDEDELYDLVEDNDQAVAARQLLNLSQEREGSRAAEVGESSQAAEKRSLAVTPPPIIRQLVPEPPDHVSPEEELQRQLKLWPTVEQYIPVEEWHPCRLVFDERDRLILPPGSAHNMYAFLTRARYEVRQFDLNHPEVQPFITRPAPGQGGPRGQRPTLDFQRLSQSFHQWDPRIQNLLSQVGTTAEGNALSKHRKQWRAVIRFRKLEISLAQLHDRAAAIGITQGHRQRPASSDFAWPHPVPVRVERNLSALVRSSAKRMRVESPESGEIEGETAADQPASSPSDQPADLLIEEIPTTPRSEEIQPTIPADTAAMQLTVPQDPLPPVTHDLHELRERYQQLSAVCKRAEGMTARLTLHRMLERDFAALGTSYRELHAAFIALNNRYQSLRQQYPHRPDPDFTVTLGSESD